MTGSDRRVVVVGAGNAALCAALAAREAGARVTVLERAPEEARGGNSYFTDGAIRFAYEGIRDVREVVEDFEGVPEEEVAVGAYPPEAYVKDLARITGGRTDRTLAGHLADASLATMRWLRAQGVPFRLLFRQQAFRVEGRWRFWGGLIVQVRGGGPVLVDRLLERALAGGVEVRYRSRARALLRDEGGRIRGVRVETEGAEEGVVEADAVILASGGFEADPEWRSEHLGPEWASVRTRGSRFNTGDGLRMALDAGADPCGDWGGCHAVAADAAAPAFGLRASAAGEEAPADPFKRHSYPLGIVVNRDGSRFVDEGADFRNYTYAAYGREVLRQPGGVAWQVFDGKVADLLREEYRLEGATRVRADDLESLADRLRETGGVDGDAFLDTVARFNAAVRPGEFDPNELDGKGTEGIDPPKSNWALPLDTPPFLAYPVACAITFTFGGIRVDNRGRVLDAAGRPIPGLLAAGELVGGIFYENYPGGAGLMSGAVFGRTAGGTAGEG